MTLDPYAALATNGEAQAHLTDRQRTAGALSAGYSANALAREAAAEVERSERGDALRAFADGLEARTGAPSSASAFARLSGAYTDRRHAEVEAEASAAHSAPTLAQVARAADPAAAARAYIDSQEA